MRKEWLLTTCGGVAEEQLFEEYLLTKSLVMLVLLQREDPRGPGAAGEVITGARLWQDSRIHRSNLWHPLDSGSLLPMVQGGLF